MIVSNSKFFFLPPGTTRNRQEPPGIDNVKKMYSLKFLCLKKCLLSKNNQLRTNARQVISDTDMYLFPHQHIILSFLSTISSYKIDVMRDHESGLDVFIDFYGPHSDNYIRAVFHCKRMNRVYLFTDGYLTQDNSDKYKHPRIISVLLIHLLMNSFPSKVFDVVHNGILSHLYVGESQDIENEFIAERFREQDEIGGCWKPRNKWEDVSSFIMKLIPACVPYSNIKLNIAVYKNYSIRSDGQNNDECIILKKG